MTPRPFPQEPEAEWDFRLDRAGLADLAETALAAARAAGANYADIRLGATRRQSISAREARLDDFSESVAPGFGLRVLVDGCWGFYGARALDAATLAEAARRAVAQARAVAPIRTLPVFVEETAPQQAEWIMPMGVDPFAVEARDKVDLLLAVNAAAQEAGADYCHASLAFAREDRFFADSRGSRIFQSRTRTQPSFLATVVDKSGSGRFATRESLAPARAAGWDYALSCDLVSEAKLAAREAREKLEARPVEAGVMDVVIDPTNLWLTIHETVGHSTELDRVLGWEANFAGTSFVKPHMLNDLRFGSELMTIRADRSQDGGLAGVAYDDDGAPRERAEFEIVSKGVLRNFQMALGQAHLIGAERSNGCAYADDPTAFPIQRMPNISLAPNSSPCSLEELIGGVERGIYVVGAGSWSIDQQRDNFQFGGQLFYEIRDGRLGEMVRDAAYQGRTIPFWNSLDGLGDASTYRLCGTFTCGKAEPMQLAPVSHGAPAARFRGLSVLNTGR
ncbi:MULTISPECIES: TldD/PmbA family protein [Methylosinus]|uniref:TldD/PmbA family protein n=1 Tax=Methylosinus trichosporium (strain ATCC 35070 / NCIMB 11131 / UNIQEM 75 / OB3b) TaxID=595536 RepID=A0A2D2CZW4_METT3|nr:MULTISPECIES: TldD/PmbA family protein [Methylosinus]ATQ68287.1 TldD/PmbA family protein [Methylosinus trichosporium OB3b]OBS50972.1 peptidase [Methylosinus sp. 3S-1]